MEGGPDVEMGSREPSAIPPPILEQARLGNLDQFQAKLEHNPLSFKAGPDVYSNRTALHLAAMKGHDAIVEFILRHPDISRDVVNAKDHFGYTPLHLAVWYSRESVVRLLLSSSWVLPDRFLAASSEPDEVNEYHGGYTPLHLAAKLGLTTIASMLLRQPCQVEFDYDPVDIRATTWLGETSLDLSKRHKFIDLADLLESSDTNWLQQERERNANSANAILVGAALVAAAAFGCWLQPPGDFPSPDPTTGAASAEVMPRVSTGIGTPCSSFSFRVRSGCPWWPS